MSISLRFRYGLTVTTRVNRMVNGCVLLTWEKGQEMEPGDALEQLLDGDLGFTASEITSSSERAYVVIALVDVAGEPTMKLTMERVS